MVEPTERLAVLEVEVDNIKARLDTLVTRDAFRPVMLISYGLSGSILAGVLGALLRYVLR